MCESEKELYLKAVIEEWKDLRDEIKRRIDQRTVITQFMITLVSALLTAAVLSGNFYIIGIIPFAAAYCLYHVKATYYIHRWLTTYIRDQIENRKMNRIFPNSDVQWLSWETYYKNEVSEKEKKLASRRPFYNLFELSLYLSCGAAFSWYTSLHLPFCSGTTLVVLYWVCGFGALWLSLMIDPYNARVESTFLRRVQTILVGLSKNAICVFLIGVVALIVLSTLFSAIPWAFTFLLVGKIIGPYVYLKYVLLFVFVGTVSLVSTLASMKLKKNGALRGVALSLIISFLIMALLILSFSLVFMRQVLQAKEKIDMFVVENRNLSLQDYVTNVSLFLSGNVHAAWDRPEASFAINRLICSTCLDPPIMKIWGISAADLIVYQGWGSCGEAAILIEELLHSGGYDTRQAHFIGIDHEWAEVKYNETWRIVDPWYIGNLMEAQNLKNAKPDFQKASGVEVQYENGTIVDASHEHGY
jgi:hypothetical protein